ncbi:homoserine O-acetyltransferase MetX [Dermatobacter hominis]|uniref:homoserine O-acetyltransferase MetX n=1 Tax=Dermatobacter hominis TaxID=2884263 RepID=UPI001D0FAC3A|nr:homoserine O-acetyltransferase [Dermatobacter hominis]UDY36787.1 homoserine O-acetyltransferase [Dermatobacter hominis]
MNPRSEHDIPATGAWRPGDPVADRRFCRVAGADDADAAGSTARPFRLEGGGLLAEVDVAYEAWGELAPDGSNAVLVCHALTGDAHVAGRSGPGQPTPGWWDALVGPGRALDTDRLFVVCSNVLGGCQGTTGPSSIDPETGKPYGSNFPVVTIRDMVRVQALLADRLGIRRWRAVVGGSMGGMQALEWGAMYPERVGALVVASTTASASAQQIAWSHIGRMAVQSDPRFRGGDYYDADPGEGPHRGLAVARMCAQVTYRSDEVFTERFHRSMLGGLDFTLDPLFDVEGYLDYHGTKLARRFDANSYVRLNRAMDLHDLARGRGSTESALARITAPTLVASVRSDGLYPPIQQHVLADGLRSVGGDVTWVDIDSPHGHDGFLIETPQLAPPIRTFLETT